jgi:D-alanine-D-alanine ligase
MGKHVALLMGGHSAEREVSLNSGKAVGAALQTLGHQISEVNDIRQLKQLDRASVDVVFNVLHGADGEDGQLAAWLNLEGYRSTCCDYIGACLSWHKDLAKSLVAQAGVKTPESQLIEHPDELVITQDESWIIKPACEGSSVGLYQASNEQQLRESVAAGLQLTDQLLVERFISGMECTVGVVNGQVLPVVEIEPAEGLYDYQAKYLSQSTRYHCPARLSEDIQKGLRADAMKAFSALQISRWGRVDFIVDDEGNRWFLEVNTTPGMTTSSLLPKAAKAHGWTFEQLVAEILATSGVMDDE